MNERRRNRRETPSTIATPVTTKPMAGDVQWWLQVWRGERTFR
jgi:hypothetical protein